MSAISVIYCTLIIKGAKNICQVPLTIREEVRQGLVDLEQPQLANVQCADDPQPPAEEQQA